MIRIRNAVGIAWVALACMAGTVRADDKDYEALFGALRTRVAELKPYQSEEVQGYIEQAYSHIIDCPPGKEPEESVANVGIEGVEYSYNNIYTDDDDQIDGTYCFNIVKPLHRRLSADEGRDFSAALMIPDIQRFMPGLPTPEELAARAKVGEKHFAELRAVVASGIGVPRDPDDTKLVIGDLSLLVDCSHVPFEELVGDPRPTGFGRNTTLYNDVYHWIDLDPEGARCIYLVAPLRRGLSVDEARDLLNAVRLDLGYSDAYRREFDPDGLLPPNPIRLPAAPEDGRSETGKKKATQPTPSVLSNPAPLTDSRYPYNTIAVLNRPGTGTGITASAVQVGHCAYMTAAPWLFGAVSMLPPCVCEVENRAATPTC